MTHRISLALLVASAACSAPSPVAFTSLQANVGNTLLSCGDHYVYKLCEVAVEEHIRDQIRALSPDVIALQEVLPDGACAGFVEDDPAFVCHADHLAADPSQIHRLLGDAYDFVCDDRHGYECVAAKRGVVDLASVYQVAPPVTVDGTPCDDGFSVGLVQLRVAGAAINLVNGHPQSGWTYGCRKAELDQVFDGLAAQPHTLLSGDWNLDPFQDSDVSADAWVAHVGDGVRFHYHSGVAERTPPFPTNVTVLTSAVLDHVVSDVFDGTCATLGEAPGTARLDGGAGCDHRALLCGLELPLMCDTVVVVDPVRGTWLAKNSDREPGEAQLVERVPGGAASAKVQRCTHIEVPAVDRTFETVISRPFWMWGAEMGVNAMGVAIGNEAVFTKAKLDVTGLTGMDLLRLALERAGTAREAVDVITRLLREHGQGGRMGYRNVGFRYSSSFLIADPSEAWVLETAGRHWAAQRVTHGVRSISNALTIDEADLVDDESPRAFARHWSDGVMSALAGAHSRRACTARTAAADFSSMARALRDHAGQHPAAGLRMSTPCAHASLWPTRTAGQTTASMIAALSSSPRVWMTGTSSPCLSVFKPVPFADAFDAGPAPGARYDPDSLYWRHERLHRAVLRDWSHAAAVRARADALEAVSGDLWEQHRALIEEWRAELPPARPGPGPFHLYWRRQDALEQMPQIA